MEVSILVAQVYGLICVALGLGLLINGAYYKKVFNALLKDSGYMFFGGIMALVVGFLIVSSHNVWVKDWTVLVTIIGWIALLKGITLFLAPKFLVDLSRPMLKNMKLVGVGVLVLGLVMGYFGFFA